MTIKLVLFKILEILHEPPRCPWLLKCEPWLLVLTPPVVWAPAILSVNDSHGGSSHKEGLHLSAQAPSILPVSAKHLLCISYCQNGWRDNAGSQWNNIKAKIWRVSMNSQTPDSQGFRRWRGGKTVPEESVPPLRRHLLTPLHRLVRACSGTKSEIFAVRRYLHKNWLVAVLNKMKLIDSWNHNWKATIYHKI